MYLVTVQTVCFRCPPNACDNAKCDSQLTAKSCSANGGYIKVKGGFCQCCDICVKTLSKLIF